MVLTGSLFNLCIHPLTRHQLNHLGVIDILLQTKDNDLLITYFSCLGIAYLLADETNKINKKKKQEGLHKLTYLVKTITPRELRDKESEVGFVWTSAKSFMNLVEANEPTVQIFGALCLANLSYSDINRHLFFH